MNKQAFLDSVRARLSGLSEREVREQLDFYAEMIDDRVEEGLSEEDAVRDIGTADEIAAQIMAEYGCAQGATQTKRKTEKQKNDRRLRTWEIVLLALGSPVWLSLLIAAVAVVISVYAVLWSAVVSLWASFAALALSFLAGAASGVVLIVWGDVAFGVSSIGAGLVCAGAAILMFFLCLGATKGVAVLTKKTAASIGRSFVRKEKTK